MTEHPGTIRNIAWREIFPWLILLRTFRIAISPTLLALAALAVVLTAVGWRVSGFLFLSAEQRITQPTDPQLAAAVPAEVASYFPASIREPLLDAYFAMSEPLARFFQLNMTLREAAFYAFGFLWTLAVWSFPGGVISRRAIVQLAIETTPGIFSTARFGGRRWLWYFLAPLYPVLAIAFVTLPIAALGLVLRMHTGFGAAIAGLAWIVVALISVGAMWLFGGLIFGWPLMWPAISAERDGDPFEAFSRSYSYVYGKPLHYFFYVLVAAAFGALCWAVVYGATVMVQEFGFWALSWGGGREAVIAIRDQALDVADGDFDWQKNGTLWNFGTTIMGVVLALIRAVAAGFRFTFFFTAASAIYLLLRYHVDEKEMDEVFIEPGDEASPPIPHTRSAADVEPAAGNTSQS